MTTSVDPAPTDECPHGFPARYIKRCALCRAARRREAEQARFRAALLTRPDIARVIANDPEHEDQ